ncbi:MAG TPA: TIGR02680 family protein [Jatrophihabitans sp.]|nr:TIGR02680 family protein [Jatrophihabitans sp.]
MTHPPRRFDERWRLSRAGIVNVWHYLDNEFDLGGGRMILRGTNGSGKSRALEMLLPFLLDADRRRMDATGTARVSLDELMRTGAREQANRTGYLWLELARPGEYLTVGALVRHSQSASTTKVWYFTTPLRVGDQLQLLSDSREPLTREALTDLVGADRITDSPAAHRERVRGEVFGLDGDAGRDRYAGLLQLLHTLRAPDVGNRIDEGRLPPILLESLPPLGEQALTRAGEQLDGLTETRAALQRLEQSADQVDKFLGVYRRYAAGVLRSTAGETLAAADAVQAAETNAAQRAQQFAALQREHGALQERERELAEELAELDHALKAIEARDIFKTADDLLQRDTAVQALATTVDQAIASAQRERASHARDVNDADGALDDLRHEADDAAQALAATREALVDAGLPTSGLPDAIRVISETEASETALIRTSRHDPPRSVRRPAPAMSELVPEDPAAASHLAEAAAVSAADRLGLAQRRLAEARRLDQLSSQVAQAEAEAGRLAAAADDDRATAELRADDRDAAALALAHDWRAWTADHVTVELLGGIDWATHPAIGPLLIDAATLAGDEGPQLGDLEAAAETAARPARTAIAAEQARLDDAEREATEREVELRGERDGLVAARDPLPQDAPWLAPDRPGEPLWQCVDFAEDVADVVRAGLEGALLAAGLLTAVVAPDGSVRAADGELLLRPGAARPERPLSGLITADPAATLPAETINAVLDSIGAEDPRAATGVFADGSWRNGPLHGRHVVDRARYIGAAARASNRAERIAAIDAELGALAAAAEQRMHRRAQLDTTTAHIDEHIRAAPGIRELFAARSVAAEAARRAENSARIAAREAERARALRAAWAAELASHQAACAHYALPVEADALQNAVDAARHAREHSVLLARSLTRLADRLQRHRERLRRVTDAAARRDDAEGEAERHWHEWHAAGSEVAAQHEALDLSIEQATAELERTKTARANTDEARVGAFNAMTELGPQLGEAKTESANATALVQQRLEEMFVAAQQFTARLALPGLLAAATDEALAGIVRPEQVDEARAAADTLLTRITEPRQPASLNVVYDRFREFDREVSGQLDVKHTLDGDRILLVAVAGAGDDHTLAGAARALAIRVEQGRTALSDREREVFTRFVLGGVAEELRRRVNQAGQLIHAMNNSLRGIETSNGIGVRLGWGLREEHAALGRVLELVATSDAVRSEAQNAELTELLRRRVEASHAADPSSGYATHLATALDYRQWHEVRVTITGPEPGQQRRLSKRAKLSQGETRFVSYMTLFAAADGYLTSLGDDGRALRLILLDDAFAKVDDGTVAELMGLLVTLDLDFVMTGHALWGCFPQVPRLDVYEVRRRDGSSAITTHIHWDGRNRHLRSTA